MPRLLSRIAVTPRAQGKLRRLSVVLLVLLAAFSWWSVIQEGPSPARVILAVATTVAAVLDAFVPKKRRLRRRSPSVSGPD
jgi:DMSO/TMAO reductase YedYZ heme-binding membrane subunit